MNKLELVKAGVRIIVTSGVSYVVSDIFKASYRIGGTSVYRKIALFAGSIAVAGLITKHTDKYINDGIDLTVKQIKDIVNEIEEVKSEGEATMET
jgi:hypothetical protein